MSEIDHSKADLPVVVQIDMFQLANMFELWIKHEKEIDCCRECYKRHSRNLDRAFNEIMQAMCQAMPASWFILFDAMPSYRELIKQSLDHPNCSDEHKQVIRDYLYKYEIMKEEMAEAEGEADV